MLIKDYPAEVLTPSSSQSAAPFDDISLELIHYNDPVGAVSYEYQMPWAVDFFES